MYLSSNTKQAIQYKSSAKKSVHLCTELGGVNDGSTVMVHQMATDTINDHTIAGN